MYINVKSGKLLLALLAAALPCCLYALCLRPSIREEKSYSKKKKKKHISNAHN